MANAGDITDLDSETPDPAAPNTPTVITYIPPATEPPDSTTRKWVSFFLLMVLAAVILAAFVQLFRINNIAAPLISDPAKAAQAVSADAEADADRLMRLMNIVFGPVVTLVSSVVGFYFGARTAKEGAAS